MTLNLNNPTLRTWLAALLLTVAAGNGQATVDVPDVPLFMNSTGVKPNFILSLDDSGSMAWTFAISDALEGAGCSNSSGPTSGCSSKKYYKSTRANALYYNPRIQYTPPPRYNGTTCTLDATNPSTCYPNVSFTATPLNGFDTSRGASSTVSTTNNCNPRDISGLLASPVDLANGYAASQDYNPNNNSQVCAAADGEATSATTQTYSGYCRVDFNRRDGTDRIEIDSGTGCAGIFANLADGMSFTVSGTGNSNYDRSYTVAWTDAGDGYIYVDQAIPSDWYDRWATITYTYTSSATSYPAYYYLFYSELGITRPSLCTSTVASQKSDEDCYIKVNVGSTGSGTAGTGWQYADIYRNPDGSAATVNQKRQNFANWYSYYRTRNLALVSNVMAALTGLDDSVRVAWQALNTCKSWPFSATACKGWDLPANGYDQRIQALGGTITNGIDPALGTANATHRQELYAWLSRLPANSGTPLRSAAVRAGKYCDAAETPLSASSPFAESPPTVAGTYHSCRRNIHLLMTDGIWNSDSITGYGNANSTTTDLPGGYRMPSGSLTWTPGHPYSDGSSDNIADISFYYWSKDLQPGLADSLTPLYADRSGDKTAQWVNPKNDPAEWQHMTTYAIGLGLSSALTQSGFPQWGGDTYSGDYPALVSGTQNWPATSSDASPENAYDLWHGAISGRGKFYSAEDAQSLKAAFKDVVDTVSSIASAGGGAGLGSNSTKIATDTTVYLATFSGDWSGSLQAIPVQSDGSLGTAYWDASQLIPYADDRHLFTLNGGIAQNFSTCTGDLAAALNQDKNGTVDGLCSQRLAWLRGNLEVTGATWSSISSKATYTVPGHGFVTGDLVLVSGVTPSAYNGTFSVTVLDGDTFTVDLSTNPGAFATDTIGTARYSNFRNRAATVLGDIMNSDPIYVHKEDFGYAGASVTLTGHDSYAAYVTGKSSRTPTVIVGANDGMLHAFGADSTGTYAGKELFGFIPSGVYGNLSKLTSPNYEHKFFVDGSPTVGDAYVGGGWKTYLVSGLGGGGKSIFALDVSNISQFASPGFNPDTFSASSLVKWEYTDPDLGLTMSQPQIGATTSTEWAVIAGNGYNSASDGAYLHVVDLYTGNQTAKIGAGGASSNGLATPFLYDNNGDKVIDVVYAGDLQGNLWKFVNSAGSWSLGNGGLPLFTASRGAVAQPITSQPKAIAHPNGGAIVYFGTGSYITNADLTDDHTQTFYAIWDDGTTGTVQLADLQEQVLTTSGTFRMSTSNTVDWANQRGWYMDLPSTPGMPAERILSAPLLKDFTTIEDRVVFVSTIPTSDPCDRGGISWLMELGLITGSQLTSPVLDTNGDGTIDASDTIVSGQQMPNDLGITKTPLWLEGGEDNSGYAFKFFTGSKGTTAIKKQTSDPSPPPGGGGGHAPVRVYWQQIL